MRLAWELPANTPLVTWSSEAAETIDYLFMYGPALDKVVADYRDLTAAGAPVGNGPGVSGSARSTTPRNRKSSTWWTGTVICTFP